MNIWNWLNTNAGAIGVLLLVLPILWSVWQYINLKNKELKFQRFKIYHDLIKNLVEAESPDRTIKLDRQIAIVFELRNFPEYYGLSHRILSGLKESWKEKEPDTTRLCEELDLTIKHIKRKI